MEACTAAKLNLASKFLLKNTWFCGIRYKFKGTLYKPTTANFCCHLDLEPVGSTSIKQLYGPNKMNKFLNCLGCVYHLDDQSCLHLGDKRFVTLKES